MTFFMKALLLVTPWLQIPSDQPRPQLSILLLNGITGKPISNARLLVFAGSTPEDVRLERHEFDLTTDSTGLAAVPPGQMWAASLQVFVDFMHVCQPQTSSLSLPEAMTNGLIAPNSCGPVKIKPKPGQLVLFARKPTLRERMAW